MLLAHLSSMHTPNHTRARVHTLTRIPHTNDTYSHIHTCSYTITFVHTHISHRMCAHTHKCLTHSHLPLVHSKTQRLAHTHTSHTTQTLICMLTSTITPTHMYTQPHTLTHVHSHTYTHTLSVLREARLACLTRQEERCVYGLANLQSPQSCPLLSHRTIGLGWHQHCFPVPTARLTKSSTVCPKMPLELFYLQSIGVEQLHSNVPRP